MIKLTLLSVLIIVCFQRVIEITSNNLVNVLKLQQTIQTLFFNPQCSVSRKYKQSFLQLKQERNLGIVDCSQQEQMCSSYKVIVYPSLIRISKSSFQRLQPWEFMNETKMQQIQAYKIVKKLRQVPNYVVVVLEQEGLPILNTVKNQRVFYLQPSKLSKVFLTLAGYTTGCWIWKMEQTSKSQQRLDKYYCGNGHNPQIIEKSIEDLKNGKLRPYIINEEIAVQHSSDLSHQQLKQLLQNSKRHLLLYFWSKSCPACLKDTDYQILTTVVSDTKKIGVYSFSMDENQFSPQKFKFFITKLPTVVLLKRQVNGQRTPYLLKDTISTESIRQLINIIQSKQQQQQQQNENSQL